LIIVPKTIHLAPGRETADTSAGIRPPTRCSIPWCGSVAEGAHCIDTQWPSQPGAVAWAQDRVDLVNYRQHLLRVERLKATTINRKIQALKKLFGWARQKGYLKSDVSR
jgi:hypothetical protein